jgi:hypothetical protein
LCSKRHQLSFLQRCAASVAQRFFVGCARLQGRALLWPSGLTLRSSDPHSAGRLPWPLVPSYSALCRPAFIPALRLLKGFSFGFWRCAGLRLRCWRFQAFWPLALVASATSYHSCSAAPLPWPSAFSWAAHVFKAGRPFGLRV